ncbi:MAG: hypothetical protein WKF73_12260 [Nocardioidaceae bacterium]
MSEPGPRRISPGVAGLGPEAGLAGFAMSYGARHALAGDSGVPPTLAWRWHWWWTGSSWSRRFRCCTRSSNLNRALPMVTAADSAVSVAGTSPGRYWRRTSLARTLGAAPRRRKGLTTHTAGQPGPGRDAGNPM